MRSSGYSIHTLEYNAGSNSRTIDNHTTVLFRRRDLESLVAKLENCGHEVAPLDFSWGDLPLDSYIDLPPFENISPHLKAAFHGFACTSFGLIIRKG